MTPVQRKELRARAHALKPVIMVGDAGLSDAVLAETDRALHDHELIKVRLSGADRETREQMAAHMCAQLEAQQIQAIGHIRVIFRANPPPEPERISIKKTTKKTNKKGARQRPQGSVGRAR
jgi:RNA-binding protein